MKIKFMKHYLGKLFLNSLLIFIINLIFINNLSAQKNSKDILPYINELIGSPKNSDSQKKINEFEKKLREIHNAGDDFPVSITYEYDSYLGLDFIKKISLISPYEKGTYYYPLQISLGDFTLNTPSDNTYNPSLVDQELIKTTKVSYQDYVNATQYIYPDEDLKNYEKIKHSLRSNNPLRALIIEPLQAVYKGKTKKSPYGYTPQKDHLVFCGFYFIIDKNQLAAKGNYTKYFTQKAKIKHNLSDTEADYYFNVLYDNITSLYSKKYALNQDEIDGYILPKVKKLMEMEDYINSNNNSLLGDKPMMNSKFAFFKLDPNSYNCSGGNCFYRKQSVNYKFGTFEGYFLNNRATEGRFKFINNTLNYELNLFSKHKNGFMDSIYFKNDLYSYTAVFDFSTKKWNIKITCLNKKTYTGEMTYLCGNTKGSEDDDYIHFQVFLFNLNFGLKNSFIKSYDGYAFVSPENTNWSSTKSSFLWNAVKTKIEDDKLSLTSPSGKPTIFRSSLGDKKRGLSFYSTEKIEISIIPEYKEFLEVLLNNLNEAQSGIIKKPLMDYYSFNFLMGEIGDAMGEIQKIQYSYISDAYKEINKYNRINSSLSSSKIYAEKMVKTLESLFEATALLKEAKKHNPSKIILQKIKEWEDFEASVKDDYTRLKEAIEIDYYKLPKDKIKAYIKKLTVEFR